MSEVSITPESISKEQTVIDEFVTNSKSKISFPLLYIENPSDALAVLLDSANRGDLPLVVQYNGRFAKLASIKAKPEFIRVVVETFKCVLYVSPTTKYSVNKLEDFFDVRGFQLEPLSSL